MTGLAYLGRGEFIPGVPARDLTAEEARRFAGAIAEHATNTGRTLYGAGAGDTLEHEGAQARKITKREERERAADPAAGPESTGDE